MLRCEVRRSLPATIAGFTKANQVACAGVLFNRFLEEVLGVVQKAVFAVFNPSFIDAASILICAQQTGDEAASKSDSMECVVDMAAGMPALVQYLPRLKAVLRAFRQSRNATLEFCMHRVVYTLGALATAAEVIKNSAQVGEAIPDMKDAMLTVAEQLSKSVTLSRKMVKHISGLDLELADGGYWIEAHDDRRAAMEREWAVDLVAFICVLVYYTGISSRFVVNK